MWLGGVTAGCTAVLFSDWVRNYNPVSCDVMISVSYSLLYSWWSHMWSQWTIWKQMLQKATLKWHTYCFSVNGTVHWRGLRQRIKMRKLRRLINSIDVFGLTLWLDEALFCFGFFKIYHRLVLSGHWFYLSFNICCWSATFRIFRLMLLKHFPPYRHPPSPPIDAPAVLCCFFPYVFVVLSPSTSRAGSGAGMADMRWHFATLGWPSSPNTILWETRAMERRKGWAPQEL